MKISVRIVTAALFASLVSNALAWGEDGHATVGAMADKLIAGTPAAAHVHALLGDETLAIASIWADQIKGRTNQWAEGLQFKSANTNHSAMHYTDIPFEESKYRDDSVGARPDDVVHAIAACVLILQGKPQAQTVFSNVNEKIALRLLVHYIGDLHQPLHVGSGFLDGRSFIDPNGYGKPYSGDEGANQLVYGPTKEKLHFYWDVTVVREAMTNAAVQTPQEFAAKLLAKPDPTAKDSGSITNWARSWADESLALSAKVHDVKVLNEEDYQDHYSGKMRHRWHIADLSPDYIAWSAATAESQLDKAGHRLAETLEAIWPN